MNAILIQRDKRRITRQFRARVSDSLVDTLIDNPSALSMAGQKREITVLFADLAGFTSISEQLGSERTVALANTALSAMSSAIVEHDGYVNKFLGDGLMAFWSAFEPQADQARLACDAALACQASLEAVNMDSDVQLGLRLGIATGEAIVGDCGAPPDLNDYTAIGNTVNLAARLESANKQLGTTILVDAATRSQAGGAARTLPIGPVVVVGQTQSVALHAIVGRNVTDDEIAAATALQEAVTSGDRAGAQAALEAMGDHRSLDALAVLWAEVIDDGSDLVVHRNRILEIAEQHVGLGGQLGDLGRHLRVGGIEEVNHPRRAKGDLPQRLRGTQCQGLKEVFCASHGCTPTRRA